MRRAAPVLTLAALLAAAALGAGCGDGGGRGLGRAHLPELTERDAAGDVGDGRAMEIALESDEIEEAFAGAFTDERPELDLRGAGVAIEDRTLRLRVLTEGPIGPGSFTLSLGRAECSDDQLVAEIHVDDDGAATVRATDLPDERMRPVDGAVVDVDGEQLRLSLPLLADTTVGDWYVHSASPNAGRAGHLGYGDSVPDWYIEGAYFTRGTGTPNYAGPPPCGPPDPPLLPR